MPYSGRTSISSPRRRADGTPPRSFAGSEPGDRHRAERVPRTRRRRSNGAGIGRIARRTYDYFLYVVSTLPLRSTRVRRQHSPFSLLCITMILLIGNDIEFLDSTKGYLNKSFSMKDLGEAAYI